jgi:hypothetical protein
VKSPFPEGEWILQMQTYVALADSLILKLIDDMLVIVELFGG